MLDTIKQIGIFMIAAQAVVHFAPGKPYEKYIKSVAGIIILLLFLKPIWQLAGAEWEEPRALLEEWEEMTDVSDFSVEREMGGVSEAVAARMETALAERLNSELAEEAYFVSRVSIRFIQEPGAKEGNLLPEITVFMREREEESGRIGIEEIVIGQSRQTDTSALFLSYRSRFAALLEMEEERVEVRSDGRG